MVDINKAIERIKNLQTQNSFEISDIKYGDVVRFSVNDTDNLIGEVVITDYQGGGIYYRICPSVDIRANGELYKHIPLVDVEIV